MMLFLRKYWAHVLLALVISGGLAYWDHLTDTIEDLTKERNDLKTEIAVKEQQFLNNEMELKDAIVKQNKAVEKARADYVVLEEATKIKFAEAEATNRQRVLQLEEQLRLLRGIETPQSCEESIELLVKLGVTNPWPLERN